MFATWNASRKLPHCGSAGHDSPTGTVPDGWSAVVKMLRNGRIVIAIERDQERPAGVQPRVGATLIGRSRGSAAGSGGSTMSTRTTSTTARAEASPTWRSRKARM